MFRRYNWIDAEFLRVSTHALGRRVCDYFLDTSFRCSFCQSLPQRAMQPIQYIHHFLNVIRCCVDHATAADFRWCCAKPNRRPSCRTWSPQCLGTNCVDCINVVWCKCLCYTACTQRNSFFRDYDEFWCFCIVLYDDSQLVPWRFVLAILQFGSMVGRCPRCVQFFGPNFANNLVTTRRGRACGHSTFSRHCFCVYLADSVFQRNSKHLFRHRCTDRNHISCFNRIEEMVTNTAEGVHRTQAVKIHFAWSVALMPSKIFAHIKWRSVNIFE